MPIDGITFTCAIDGFNAYQKRVPGLNWVTPLNTKTLLPEHTPKRYDKCHRYSYKTITHISEVAGLRLIAREVFRTHAKDNSSPETPAYQCELEVRGSLHKHFSNHNSGQFKFEDLRAEIKALTELLKIDPENAKIDNIELGVNINLEYDPGEAVVRIVSYKGNSFNRYRDKRVGKCCPLKSDFEIKIYNKSVQERIPGNILRYELHYNRMRFAKGIGIASLIDLTDNQRVYGLRETLMQVWDNIVAVPTNLSNIQLETLSEKDRDLLSNGRDPEYWSRLYDTRTGRDRKKLRDRIKLIDRTIAGNIHGSLSIQIGETWDKLFYDSVTFVQSACAGEADKRVMFGQGVEGTEVDKAVTFVASVNAFFDSSIDPDMRKQIVEGSRYDGNECHIKIKETNVTYPKTVRKSARQNTTANCITCGKELHPDQRKGSRFCSEKYSGRKEARKCRNEQSNKQKKRKRPCRL